MREVKEHLLSKYNHDITNWAVEEQYPYWSEDEQDEVGEIFGNVDMGEIWRGLKVNTLEELEEWENIKSNNQSTFDLKGHMASATPDRETAKTFMEYKKSYFPEEMANAMRQLAETGCAGEYAAVLVKFKARKRNVLWSNYKNSKNDNSLIPERTAEIEVFVRGELEITELIIQYSLNKENYKKHILDTISEATDMKNNAYGYWIRKNLSTEEQEELSISIIEKLKDAKKLKQVLFYLFSNNSSTMSLITEKVFNYFPEIEKYIIENTNIDKEAGLLYIKNGAKKISIHKSFNEFDFGKKYIKKFENEFKTIITNFESSSKLEIVDNINIFSNQEFLEIDSTNFINDDYRKFKSLEFISKDKDVLLTELKNCDYYLDNKEILIDFINDMFENEYVGENRIEYFKSALIAIDRLRFFIEDEPELIEEIMRYFYSEVSGGPGKDMNYISRFSEEVLARSFAITTKILKMNKQTNESKDKKNTLKNNI